METVNSGEFEEVGNTVILVRDANGSPSFRNLGHALPRCRRNAEMQTQNAAIPCCALQSWAALHICMTPFECHKLVKLTMVYRDQA